MTKIEKACNKVIQMYNEIVHECGIYHPPISIWDWNRRLVVDHLLREYLDKEIKEGDTTECLTSNSEYIRNCKRFWMKKGNK